MLLKHFFTPKIAHSSYILAGKSACAVIDPQRDVDLYLDEARSLGVDITHIIQTHLHADFITGDMELVSEGESIRLEDMELQVLETPGHTPEHLSYVVIDHSRADAPVGVFVGDTLFVGDVGRPDLFPDQAHELAGKLYESLHEKLLKLPDHVEVYPAHGAGSLCGRAMGAKWRSTIGYERAYNAALQIEDKAEFIRSLTENMPPAPDHFSRCSDINRRGAPRSSQIPPPAAMDVDEVKRLLTEADMAVLDTRSYHAFAGQHLPGAWHLDLNGNFPTFAGWVLPTEKDVLLVTDDYQRVAEANRWARRVGVDRIVGFLDGGMTAWATSGGHSAHIELVSTEELHDMIIGHERFVLLDVRAPLEYEENHIDGAINIPVAELRTRYRELDGETKTVLVCSSGNRSSLGASILKQNGFRQVYNLAGGMSGYGAAGYTRECKACVNPHGSRFFANVLGQKKRWQER